MMMMMMMIWQQASLGAKHLHLQPRLLQPPRLLGGHNYPRTLMSSSPKITILISPKIVTTNIMFSIFKVETTHILFQ